MRDSGVVLIESDSVVNATDCRSSAEFFDDLPVQRSETEVSKDDEETTSKVSPSLALMYQQAKLIRNRRS